MADKRIEKTCEEVGCRLKGYFLEKKPNGETFICVKLRHESTWHIKKIPLSKLNKEAMSL
jgi:hypothetical protein